jgi:hypothetical protein
VIDTQYFHRGSVIKLSAAPARERKCKPDPLFHVWCDGRRYQAMKALVIIAVLAYISSRQQHALARPVGLLQQQLKTVTQQPNPDGEDDDKWNTRPIIGILTQVIAARFTMLKTSSSSCQTSLHWSPP